MSIFRKNNLRCPLCLAEFNHEAIRGGICPHCKESVKPLAMEHDGYIQVNWQDMRMLAIYANRWAAGFEDTHGNRMAKRALLNIFNKLQRFQPPNAQPLLPPVDPVIEEMFQRIQAERKKIKIEPLPETGEIKLTPDEKGNIVSPFYKTNKENL